MAEVIATALAAAFLVMPTEPELAYIEPPARPMLYVTSYNYQLGGINCDEDCSTTALTTTGTDILDWTAACPTRWLGYRYTTVVHALGQEWWCVDSLGSVENQGLTEVDGVRVFRFDALVADPFTWDFNNVFIEDYWIERRPMTEFYAIRQQRQADMVTVN